MAATIYKYSAFDYQRQGGNPAGFVTEADALTEEEMLAITKRLGYSETAFVLKSTVADFKVRFFTSEGEVDLCGHATIATFNGLRDLGIIEPGHYQQETKAGILGLEVFEDKVLMNQAPPVFYESIDPHVLVKCFDHLSLDMIETSLPIQIISTGLKDILLPLKSLEALSQIEANDEAIIQLSRAYEVVGIHAFTLDSSLGHDVSARNFAPLYGIKEESATGTSNGALGAYLSHYVHQKQEMHYLIDQGIKMGSPSLIEVRVSSQANDTYEVRVGGTAYSLT